VNVDTSASGFGEYRVCCEFEELGLPTTSASVTKKVLSFEEERSWNMVAKMKNTFIHVDPPEVKEHSASVRARTNSPPSTKFSEQPLFIVNDARWAPTYASGEPKSPQWGLDSATILEKESVRTSQAPPLLLPESSSIQREDASLVSIKEQCALLRRPQTGSSGTLAELAEKQSRSPASSVAPLGGVWAAERMCLRNPQTGSTCTPEERQCHSPASSVAPMAAGWAAERVPDFVYMAIPSDKVQEVSRVLNQRSSSKQDSQHDEGDDCLHSIPTVADMFSEL